MESDYSNKLRSNQNANSYNEVIELKGNIRVFCIWKPTSPSTIKKGEIEAVVIATGVHTFFGKTTHVVDNTNQVGHFQTIPTSNW